MKIFSNFDTKFKTNLYNKMKQIYGEDKVILVTRGKVFLWFKVILPFLLFELIYVVLFIFFYWLDLGDFNDIKRGFFAILFIMGNLFMGFKLLKRFIDYKMDFAIITPKEIVSYNQTGIFSRSSRSLDVDKIKTISVDKKGLLRSIFNFGSIIFLSEGDDSGHGDIKLDFISNPDSLRERIVQIVGYGEE